jgi:hypothetical protein
MRPLRLAKGKRVHQIGIPYNTGWLGYSRGDTVGQLVPLVMDPNVSIHEAKTFTCTIRPGRRSAYVGGGPINLPVPPDERTRFGESVARGID